MSLKVWLPLNGDLRNLGTNASVVTLASTQGSFISEGKIGEGLKTGSTGNVNLGYVPNINTGSISFAGWFKFNKAEIAAVVEPLTYTSAYTTSSGNLIGNDSYGGIGVIWETNNIYSTQSFNSLNIFSTLRTATVSKFTSSYTVEFDKWIHVVLTFEKSTGRLSLYINGDLFSYTDFTDFTNASTTVIFLNKQSTYGGNTNNPSLPFVTNDVRIYNHCLSKLEIKELSQGLVCHYKFDQIRPINNLVRNTTYSVYNNFSDCTASLVATGEIYQGCNVYRLSYTPNATRLEHVQTNLHSHGIYGFRRTFTASTKYCFWILCKPVSHVDTVIGGVASNIGGWAEIPMKPFRDGWYICGQYRNGSVTTDKTDSIFTSFKTPSATAGTPITIDFCCPHLVEGYDYILDEWDYQGTAITEEPDSSGHGYKATYTGTQETIEDTCRYSRCTKFGTNTSKAYVTLPSTAGFANTYTFSWWGKNTGNSGQMFWGFSNGNRLNVFIRSTYMWNTGDGDNNPFTGVTSITDGKWHYYAVTGDGTASKLYIDGEFKANAKIYRGITGTTIYFNGWDSSTNYCFLNSISDWRLYATPLSADDIMRLYKEAIAFSKNATGVGYEVVENGSRELLATRITATYGASGSYYTKLNSQGEIQFDGATQSCGSPYIMINPSGKKYYYDYTISVAAGNQFYIGFEKYDKDKTATSNQSCVYTLATKPSADIIKQRYRGTVNLSTDVDGRTCRYIRLRVLNGWAGTDSSSTKTATIHSLSLREIATSEGFDKLDIQKTGVFDIDTLQEYFDTSTKFEKTGMNNMREFIEK